MPSERISLEVRPIAQKVITEYRHPGGLAFAYGQGSVFMGFSQDADLNINLVWENASPPARDKRPVKLLCDMGHTPVQFDQDSLALDKLWVDGRQVDVVHHPRTPSTAGLNRCGVVTAGCSTICWSSFCEILI